MRIWPSRRTAKRLGIALAMIAGLLLVANGVMAWRTEARSNALKAAIRAAGDPASIADLAPAPIPDSDNAAAQIAGLADALKAFGTDYRAFLERTDLGKAYDQSDALPTAEQAAAMRAILDKHSALSEGVSRAAACDAWASTADFTVSHDAFLDALLERVQAFRGAMRYAGWEIAVLTAEGKTDEAVRRGIDVLKLARLHEAEPTLVSYLTSIAVRNIPIRGIDRALRAGSPSPEVRAALDEELGRADQPGQFAAMLRLERGVAMDAYPPACVGETCPPGPRPIQLRLFGWSVQRLYLGAYESLNDVIELAYRPWATFRRDFRQLEAQLMLDGELRTRRGLLADLLWPSLVAAVDARSRDLAMVRSLRTLNALGAFAESHGREAAGVNELDLPVEASEDPYTGEPLLTKRTDQGWVVYAVGNNGVDEGGNFVDWWPDVGVGAPATPDEAEEAPEE